MNKRVNRYAAMSDGTVRVHLNHGQFAIIDASDWLLVRDYSWGAHCAACAELGEAVL
jgi:hypothetical protein